MASSIVKPVTTPVEVKKVEEVVVPEVKRVEVPNIPTPTTTTATTITTNTVSAKESVVAAEKPQREVSKKVVKEVKQKKALELKIAKAMQSFAPKVEAKAAPGEGGSTAVEEVKHTHEPLKQTFHVGMILLGCGSSVQKTDGDAKQASKKPTIEERKAQLGTNLHEVTSLNIALSSHKIQTRYFSINGNIFDRTFQ